MAGILIRKPVKVMAYMTWDTMPISMAPIHSQISQKAFLESHVAFVHKQMPILICLQTKAMEKIFMCVLLRWVPTFSG